MERRGLVKELLICVLPVPQMIFAVLRAKSLVLRLHLVHRCEALQASR